MTRMIAFGAAMIGAGLIASSAASAAAVVNVELNNAGRMETLTLAPSSVPAGTVTFIVTNASFDDSHEMIIARTDLSPARLPLNTAGTRVDEKKVEGLDEVADLKPGDKGELALELKPGHYVLFCNIKNHFKDGMRAELTVAP